LEGWILEELSGAGGVDLQLNGPIDIQFLRLEVLIKQVLLAFVLDGTLDLKFAD
jgi:hypothetical protein